MLNCFVHTAKPLRCHCKRFYEKNNPHARIETALFLRPRLLLGTLRETPRARTVDCRKSSCLWIKLCLIPTIPAWQSSDRIASAISFVESHEFSRTAALCTHLRLRTFVNGQRRGGNRLPTSANTEEKSDDLQNRAHGFLLSQWTVLITVDFSCHPIAIELAR